MVGGSRIKGLFSIYVEWGISENCPGRNFKCGVSVVP